jgi:hypothetical protein
MFVYFSVEQAQSVATEPREKHPQFRGPDVFFVANVDGRCDRRGRAGPTAGAGSDGLSV